MIKIEVLGAADLQRRLNGIKDAMAKKIVRKALRAGLKPTYQEIKSKAPVGPGRTGGKWPHPPGNLKANIKIRARKYRSRLKFGVEVAAASKDKATNPFYASFGELGTKRQPARPFMKNTLKANESRIMRIVGQEIAAGLEAAGR